MTFTSIKVHNGSVLRIPATKAIEIGKLNSFTNRQEIVAGGGQNLIMDIVRRATFREHPFSSTPYIDDWRIVTNGGKIAKRIAKLCHENGIELTDQEKEQIGNYSNMYRVRNKTYHFEFSHDLMWNAGDFADRGSCYWTEYCFARPTILANNGGAIKFYRDPEVTWRGIARCWFVMDAPEPGMITIFNGYGMQTSEIAALLFVWGGFKAMRRVSIASSADVYFNGDGYILSPRPINQRDINFQWDTVYDEDYAVGDVCYSCGNRIAEGEYYIGADEEVYCEYCHSDLFSYCEHCEETVYADGMHRVITEDRWRPGYVTAQYWCEDCVHYDAVLCAECDTYHADHTYEGPDGKMYCEDCFMDRFDTCERCDMDVDRTELEEVDNQYICRECRNTYYTTCEGCGKLIDNDYMVGDVCNHCHDLEEKDRAEITVEGEGV